MVIEYTSTPGWWTIWSSTDEDGRVLADGFKTKQEAEAVLAGLEMES